VRCSPSRPARKSVKHGLLEFFSEIFWTPTDRLKSWAFACFEPRVGLVVQITTGEQGMSGVGGEPDHICSH
jgi:hypothetical protein